MTIAGIKKILREVLSEPGNGTLSWGRIASTVTLFAALVWVSYILYHTGTVPALDGITGFMLAPYGANKLGTAAQAFSNNPVNSAPPPPVPPPPPALPAGPGPLPPPPPAVHVG